MTHESTTDLRLVGAIDPTTLRLIGEFVSACVPVNALPLLLLRDNRTDALFVEVHVMASKLVPAATVDVPLDPDEQAEYRANRDIVADHAAFARMRDDAKNARSFSNLVCEFTEDDDHPLKIIGGQHRFEAIKDALDVNVDEPHGLKVYFGLDSDQRLDVQLISNTNIDVSSDLIDRMNETRSGPQLRDWCQTVGLLDPGQDFADRRARGNPITVRIARTLIANYYLGSAIESTKFDLVETTPTIIKSGLQVEEWEALKRTRTDLWQDPGLLETGREFALLMKAQRDYFSPTSAVPKKGPVDFAEKALNFAVLSSWAYIAGVLCANRTRQRRHFHLRLTGTKDPLNAAALAKGRHKSDAANYRGLGYRTDAKERGRLAELFFLQAEDGKGISSAKIDHAIKKYQAKEAALEAIQAGERDN